MKKTTKILAVLMAVITLFSMFGIVSSAISASSTAKQKLDYYEDSVMKTSAKEDVLKANNVFKYKLTADYSSLSGSDLKETMEWDDGIYDGEWHEEEMSMYFYGDSYKEYYVEGKSELVDYFSIKRDIRRFDLEYKSSKLTTASNGDITLTFVYLENFDGGQNTMTYTAKINKNGYIKSYSLKQVMKYEALSVNDNTYFVTEEMVDTYTFVYKKTAVKSISLSETEVTLGYDDMYDIAVTVNPDNATYKDFYCYSDYEVADYIINEDGTITVYAVGPGTTTLEVYSYDGDKLATCDITVKFNFFQMIIEFFRNLFESIFGIFMF